MHIFLIFWFLSYPLCQAELSITVHEFPRHWDRMTLMEELEKVGIDSYSAEVYVNDLLEHFDLEKQTPSLRDIHKNVVDDHAQAVALWTVLHRMRLKTGGGLYHKTISDFHRTNIFYPERTIFSLNAGRSGSRYLASLLNSCQGVLGLHEPLPGAGGSRDMHNTLLENSFDERHHQKINAILASMTAAHKTDGSVVYAETNPNFKVWFWDVVLEDFGCQRSIPVDILVIRKYMPAVLKSILELGWFATSSRPVGWLPTGNSVNSPVKAIAPDGSMDEYDKVISYLIFTEGMVQNIKQRYVILDPALKSYYCPTIRMHEFRAEQLYSREGALAMLASLGLETTKETEQLAGMKIDKFRTGAKFSGQIKSGAIKRHISLEYCEQRIQQYLEKARAATIKIPELPHLIPYPGYDYGQ